MKREEVEALLAACERDYIGPHPDNETLAALCRRWLEVEDAQIREVEEEMHGLVIYAYPLKKGQRVRLVPEDGLGGVDG